jgi:hypothetical protein
MRGRRCRFHRGCIYSSKVFETLQHVVSLPMQLFFIGKVLPLTSSADSEMGAKWFDIMGRLRENLKDSSFCILALSPCDLYPERLAGETIFYKHDQSIDTRQSLSSKGQFLHLEFQFHSLAKVMH